MLTDPWFYISALIVSVAVACIAGPLLHGLAEWYVESDDVDELLERERRGRASW